MQVVAADDAEQAEKAEDTDFAEGVVTVGVAADGVGDGGEDGKRAKQEKQQKIAPARRADSEQGDAKGEAGKHARREQLAHLSDADRTTGGEAARRAGRAMAVGAAHAVTVVVGDVGEDLQGEGGQKREEKDAESPGAVGVGQRVAATDDGKRKRQGARARQFEQGSHEIVWVFINL